MLDLDKEIKCINCGHYNRPYLEEGLYWYGCLVCGTKILMRNLANSSRPNDGLPDHDKEYRDQEIKELNSR